MTASFVAREKSSGRIAGYSTLTVGVVSVGELPPDLAKRLPRYPTVPVARLGRLAVALDFQGRRVGGALLWDAVERAARSELAVYADAKDEQAERFYRHHGFLALERGTRTLFLALPKKR